MSRALLSSIAAASLAVSSISAATLEYFWDNDPGLGNGIQIDIDDPTDGVVLDELTLFTPFSSGHHELFIRVAYEPGKWGPTYPAANYEITSNYDATQLASTHYRIKNASGDTVHSSLALPFTSLGNAVYVDSDIDTSALNLAPGDYVLEILASNKTGLTTTRRHYFTLTPSPNQPPALAFLSPPALDSITENETDPTGTLVSDILAQLAPKQATDPNGDTLSLALTDLDFTNGDWQYLPTSTNQWIGISPPTKGTAFTLIPTDKIRFLPDPDYATPLPKAFAFVLWDQYKGTAHTLFDRASTEGINSLSSSDGYASLDIAASDPAPIYTGKTDFEAPSTGAALRLDLKDLFKSKAETNLVYALESIEKPELFEKYGIDQKTAELVLYPKEGKSGETDFSVSATDDKLRKTTADLAVEVVSKNQSPIFQKIPSIKLSDENPSATINLANYVTNPESPDETLSYSLRRSKSDLLSETSIDPANGILTVSSASEKLGTLSLTVSATDEAENIASQKIFVSVSTNPKINTGTPAFQKSLDLRISRSEPTAATLDPLSFSFKGEFGATYELQRSINLKDWQTEETTTVSDSSVREILKGEATPAGDRAFWRLIKSTGGVPLAVSEILATYQSDPELNGILLQIESTSREEIESIVFYDGPIALGNATELESGTWVFNVQNDPSNPRPTEIYAIAQGAEGHQTISDSTRFLLASPTQFVALDSEGQPDLGELIQVNEDGSLPAFHYYPLGSPPSTPLLWFDFPSGTRLEQVDGQKQLLFDSANLVLATNPDEPFTIPAGSLPTGDLHFDTLETLLGNTIVEGVPLLLSGTQAILWTGGPFPSNLYSVAEPPQFKILTTTPAPALENSTIVPSSNGTLLKQTWYGQFTLPNSGGVTFVAPQENPLWLTLNQNGSFILNGAVEVHLPSGAIFKGSLHFAHPRYTIRIGAESIEIPTIDSLSEFLPTDPASCIPDTDTPSNEALGQLQACLDAYRLSYRGFAASASKHSFGETGRSSTELFDPEVNLATTVIDAWGHSLTAQLENAINVPVEALAGERLAELFTNATKSAIATADPIEVIETLEAISRIQKTIENDARNKFVNIDSDEIDKQVDDLRNGFIDLMINRPEPFTWNQAERVVNAFISIEVHRAEAGLPSLTTCAIEVSEMINYQSDRFELDLGLKVRAPNPSNPAETIIRGWQEGDPEPAWKKLNRFELTAEVSKAINIEAAKVSSGSDSTSCLEEASSLLNAVDDLIEADLQKALKTKNRRVISHALEDQFAIHVARTSSGIHSDTNLIEIAAILDDFPAPVPGQELRDYLVEAKYLGYILSQITKQEIALQHGNTHYKRLAETLDDLFEEFPLNPHEQRAYSTTETITILELGLLRDRLYRSTNYGIEHGNTTWVDTPENGESQLTRLINQLALSTGATQDSSGLRNWTAIDKANQLIFDEAELMRLEYLDQLDDSIREDLNQRRFKLLSHSTSLLTHYRAIAVKEWTAEAAQLGTNAAFADMRMPGDIVIQKIAGSATFDVNTHYFSGTFSGEACLPKFDATLTVPNGSFDTEGNIAFSAFGSTDFPAEGEKITLSITERHPLSFELGPDQIPAIGGSGRLELPNGLFFETFFDIDDPEYLFGAEAGGLHFEIAQKLTVTLPHLNTEAFGSANAATLSALRSYFSAIGRSIAPVVDRALSLPSPNFNDIGDPPEFKAPTVIIPTSKISAWGNTAAAELESVINPAFNTTAEELAETVNKHSTAFADELKSTRATLTNATKRLEFIIKANQRLKAFSLAKEKEEQTGRIGLDPEIVSKMLEEATALRDLALENLNAIDPNSASITEVTTATKAVIDAEKNVATLGGAPSDALPDVVTAVESKYDIIEDKLLSEYGIDSEGTIVDPNKYQTLSAGRRYYIIQSTINMKSQLQSLGSENFESFDNGTVIVLLSQYFEELNNDDPVLRKDETAEQLVKRRLESMKVAAELMSQGSEDTEVYGIGAKLEESVEELEIEMNKAHPDLSSEEIQAKLGETLVRIQKQVDDANEARAQETRKHEIADSLHGQFNDAASKRKAASHPASVLFSIITSFAENSGNTTANSAALTSIDAYLNRQLTILAESDLANQDLASLTRFSADSLSLLIAAIEVVGNDTDGFESKIDIEIPKLLLQDITLTFNSVAKAKRAFWLTERHLLAIEAAIEEHGSTFKAETKTALVNAQIATLVSSLEILNNLSQGLDSLSLQDHVLELAGGIQIDRAFGQLAFNRLTGDWEFKIGGRLTFPDIDGYFEIVDSTFNKETGYSFHLKAGVPIPAEWIGKDVELDIDGGFILSGSWDNHIRNAEFAAQMSYDENGETNTYDTLVSYSFNPESEAHNFGIRLSTTDTFSGFGNDLVIFSLGAGADVSGTETSFHSATLYNSATVGILNKKTEFPDPYTPVEEDFELLYTGEVLVGFEQNGDASIALKEGELQLPAGFVSSSCDNPIEPGQTDARGRVEVDNLSFDWHNADKALELKGTVGYSNIRFAVKEIENLWVDVCNMELQFSYDSSAKRSSASFNDVNAIINIPLPDEEYARAELDRANWPLGGLPTFELSLVNDLKLFDEAPLSVELLGQNDIGQPTSRIALTEDSLSITGYARATIEDFFKDEDNNPVALIGGNSSTFTVNFPEPSEPLTPSDIEWIVDTIEIATEAEGSQLYLGEAGSSLFVIDPKINIVNPLGIFESRFELIFDFGLGVALSDEDGVTGETVSLSTEGSRIVFSDEPGAPFFFPGESCYTYEGSEKENLTGDDEFPLMVRELCIDFRSPNPKTGYFSLLPEEGEPFAVFDHRNLGITVSADLDIYEIISGSVDDLELRWVDGKPTANVNGLGFGVDLTETIGLPATGKVYIGGLQNLPNIFFSGQITTNIKGNAVDGIAVLDSRGLRGICFGLAGSEVNIPLPYGFTLNGGQGGIAFGAHITDPCDFKNHFPIDLATGAPLAGASAPDLPLPDLAACSLINWEQLEELRTARGGTSDMAAQAEAELSILRWRMERMLVLEFNMTSEDAAEALAGLDATGMNELLDDLRADVDENEEPDENSVERFSICPDPSTCPTASLGIAAQPHPEAYVPNSKYAGRNIIKFTSIDEATLNGFGITPELITSLVGTSTARETAATLAHNLRTGVDNLIPRLPSDFPDTTAAETINNQIDSTLQDIELGFANTLLCAIEAVNAPDNAGDVYVAIAEAAYAGIPYEDFVVKVSGEFSYIGVSSFASVTGGMISGTSGSEGLVGEIKVFGVPVGGAELYLNKFDESGNIAAPNLCGKINAKIGPFDLGSAALLFDCPGCVDKAFTAIENAINSFSSQYMYDAMVRIERDFPDLNPNPNYTPLEHFYQLDTDEKRQAFLGNMIAFPPLDSLGNYSEAYLAYSTEMANAVIPRLASCGTIQPKLFGFPLSGGNDIFAYKTYAGPENPDPGAINDRVLLLESFSFSPSRLIAQALMAGTGMQPNTITEIFFPAFDTATANFRFTAPLPGDLLRESLTSDPVEFLDARLRDTLSNSVTTFEYKIAPWGLQLSRSGGRILMPSFDHHPEGNSSYFSKPNRFDFFPPTYDQQLEARGLPNRLEVLLASLGGAGTDKPNFLADPAWAGQGSADFDLIFEGTEYQGVFDEDITLNDNFFPHGGFLGASSLALPKLITQGLPPSANELVTPGRQLPEYLASAEELFTYLFESDEVGELAFYVPAPNPPVSEFPDSVDALLEDIRQFDLETNFENFYPGDKAFMSGWIETPLLGLPTGRAEIILDGATGTFDINAPIPDDSWLTALIGQPNIGFSIAPGDNQNNSHSTEFWNTFSKISEEPINTATHVRKLVDDTVDDNIENVSNLLNYFQALPRVSAKIESSNFRIPNPADPTASLAKIDQATFEAYSPYYGLAGADGDGVRERVQRLGGIAISGDLEIGDNLLSVPSVEFSITPNENGEGFFPTIASSFELSSIGIANIFDPDAPNSTFAGNLLISSEAGELELRSESPHIFLPPFGQLEPRPGRDTIKTRFTTTADYANETWSAFDISIDAGELINPFFADSLQLFIHGKKETSPFTFSATGDWNASAHFEGDGGFVLGLEQSEPWIEIEPNNANWADDASISISNTGLSVSDLPIGTKISFTNFFPVTELRGKEVAIGGSGSMSLELGEETFSLTASVDDVLPFASRFEIQSGFDLEVSNERISLAGHLNEIAFDGLVTIKPASGDKIGFSFERLQGEGGTFSIQPALLEMWTYGPQQTLSIDGGSPTTPFTFSGFEAWSARISLDELTLDPDGPLDVFNPIVTIEPNGSGTLIEGEINGYAFDMPDFSITRDGNVDVTWFPGQGNRQSKFANVDPGSIRFRLNDSGFDLSISAPEGMLDFANLPEMDFPGSVTITSEGLVATIDTVADFSFPANTNPRLLEIEGDSSGTLSIGSDGYSLVLDPPNIEILGNPLTFNDVSEIGFYLGVGDDDLRIELETTKDIAFLGTDILELRKGTHSFTGNLDFENGDNRLAANLLGRFNLRYPDPNNLGQMTTQEKEFNLSFNTEGELDPITIRPLTEIIDYGWFKLNNAGVTNAMGTITIDFPRGNNSGAFSLEASGWDINVFGVQMNNLGMSVSTTGEISATAGNSSTEFDIGEAIGQMLIDLGAALPFRWDLQTGEIGISIPEDAELKLLSDQFFNGSFVDGIPLPAIPEIRVDGGFDIAFNHFGFDFNGTRMGNVRIQLSRENGTQPIVFEILNDQFSNSSVLEELRFDFRIDSDGDFASSISGALSVPLQTGFFGTDALLDSFDNLDGSNDNKLRFGRVDLDLILSALPEFKGSVELLNNEFDVKLSRAASCVDFKLGPLDPPVSCFTLPNLNPIP